MDYGKAIQSINDINFLRKEENICSMIDLIKRIGNHQGNPQKEQVSFVLKYMQVMCSQKEMKKQIYIESLFESLKTLQFVCLKGIKVEMKVIIMKIITFSGENSFIEQGLYLSKYFFFFQDNPSTLFSDFLKTMKERSWNLTQVEIEVAKNVVETKEKEKNIFVLMQRVKLLQRAVGRLKSYFDEIKANLTLVGKILTEKDIYYKDYVFLNHKMIVSAIQSNEKIEINQISSFYMHNLNEGILNHDQFGGMLVEILNLSRQSSFEKYLVHSIVVECIAQISSKSRKSESEQLFQNKNVITMIEVLCYQLDDPQFIDTVAHHLGQIPPNQKIKHISLLLKISQALKEEKISIQKAKEDKKKNQISALLVLHQDSRMKEDSTISSSNQNTITNSNSYGSYSTNEATSLFSTTTTTTMKNNQQSLKRSSKMKSNSKKRLSNTPKNLSELIESKENIGDISNLTQSNDYNEIDPKQSTNQMIDENQSNHQTSSAQKQQNFQYQLPHQKLNKIKEEDQFQRLCEEYEELNLKEVGGIQLTMAYNIFNSIQEIKTIYFNQKLNYKDILKELEGRKRNKSHSSDGRTNKISDELIDQDLLYLLLIQNEIIEVISEKEVNRSELRSNNLFHIFIFFLSMAQEQDNIYFTYRRSKARGGGGSSGYSVFSVQFKQLVEDILKYNRYPNLEKIDSKSSKGRSQQAVPEFKQKIEELRNFQMNYFIRTSVSLFRNNIGNDISYDLLETVMENLQCEDIDLIHTIIISYAQEENVEIVKKLRIIADRSIELLLQLHSFQNDSQQVLERQRLTSSVQKEANAASRLQSLTKILEIICVVSLIYLNTGSNANAFHSESGILPVINILQSKIQEIKECHLKNQIDSQQLFVQLIMETVCRYLFSKKRINVSLDIQGVFGEIGNTCVRLLKWNEKDTYEQLKQLVQYMEFNDFCVTQILQEKIGCMLGEGEDKQKAINMIRKMTIQSFDHFHAVDCLDVSDERAFNKVLIQILTKLTQILNTKFSKSSQNNFQQYNFKTINLKLTLINKIVYLILENRMQETSSNSNLMNTQLIYEGGSYYNQILLMLSEVNDDNISILQENSLSPQNSKYPLINWQVEHTHYFLVNSLLASDQISGSPLLSRFQFIKENVSWHEMKQLMHTLKQMKEQASYFKVGILSANLLLIEILLLRFLKHEGQALRSMSEGLFDNNYSSAGLFSQNERIAVCDEDQIKEEYYQKFIELRIEESIEEYIKVLFTMQAYEEARKIQIYATANSQVEDVQIWLKEIKKASTGKGVKQAKVLARLRAQLKCLIYEINILRIENNQLISMFSHKDNSLDSLTPNKLHLRDLMKVVDKIENKIERNERHPSSSKSAQKLDFLIMSLRMHLNCAKYIRQSNQSHLSTQIIEKTFRKLTSLCFENAYGNLNDIYANQPILLGASQKHQAAAKASSELINQQSFIGSMINPFAKIQTISNNRKYSAIGKVTGDLVEYLNIGNGFSYFKTAGSKQIQLLLLQSLRDYCKSQLAQNCFNNLKYYGKLLQTASFRFLAFDELLRSEVLLKEHQDAINYGVFIDIIGNVLQQKQQGVNSLHNLFSRRKSSVATMQLSTFIQSLHSKLLTQNSLLKSTRFYNTSMKYMIYLFTTTVRTNHRNLESEICEMIFFSSKKFQCIQTNLQSHQQNSTNKLTVKGDRLNGINMSFQKKQMDRQSYENKKYGGLCELIQSILAIDNESNKSAPYIIVSSDFCQHIISHKNRQSFVMRYITLLQSLNLLSKVTAFRVSIATKSTNEPRINEKENNEIFGLFIQLINFRDICKLLHNSFLPYNLIYAKQLFYLYHKLDETIKELLREMPSLLHVYKNYVIVKNCECVCLNQSKTQLLLDAEDAFLVESFSLDTSYMYKSVLIQSQGQSSEEEQQKQTIQQESSLKQNNIEERLSLASQSSTYSSYQKTNTKPHQNDKSPIIKSKKMESEEDCFSYAQKEKKSQIGFLQPKKLTKADFEFKRLRTSMRDFSISKYNKSILTKNLEQSFKNSRINSFAYRKHSLQQLKLEHDIVILNFIDYNNERAIQISKFNHLTQKYTSYRINSQSQTNLFADYLTDIKRIVQNNESDMKDDEKKRKSQIDPNNWWRNRTSNDKQLKKILTQMSSILDYHIFLFFGSANKEKENQIMNKLSEIITSSEEFSLTDSQSSDPSSSESSILNQEKDNLLEILFSLVKCSLFININEIKQKLIFELICTQNIYLQYLGIQSQQFIFTQIIKLKEKFQKTNDNQQKKPTLWILSENIQTVPIEYMSCFPDNNQTFYRIPSIQYLIENYKLENKVNFANNYYLLNPSGDLIHTQSKFQQKFESIRQWEGASGFSVSSNELQKVLKNYESYTYIGHGAGELYLNQKQIQEIDSIKSAILLFGCQSARQIVQLDQNQNQYEVTGTSLYLLMRKCKLLVGSLWDVTDRDTDKMIFKLIQIFEKATIKKPIDFSQAFLQAKEECLLKQLNGSAFIFFGIPTQFYMK